MAIRFDAAQHLAGTAHHRWRHAGQAGGFDAVAAGGAAVDDTMQKHQCVAGFLDQYLGVGHVG